MSARLLYAVKEAFLTLQGEGYHAGRRAVFVRFAGCNVWSGRDEDRARDTAKGCCAAWCDTDFRGTDGVNGGSYSAQRLADKVEELWGAPLGPHDRVVVLTGGEPSLVVDDVLVSALHNRGMSVHVETNGSRTLPKAIDWVTLSPKPPMPIVDQRYDEVKCIIPAVNPLDYAGLALRRYVQPLDGDNRAQSLATTIDFVMRNPEWRLSLQTHKLAGIP